MPCGELLPAGERGCVSRPDRLPVRILLPRRLDRGYSLLAGLPVPERVQDQGLLAVPRGELLPGRYRRKLPDCDSVSLWKLLPRRLVFGNALLAGLPVPERIRFDGWVPVSRGLVLPGPDRRKLPVQDSMPVRELLPCGRDGADRLRRRPPLPRWLVVAGGCLFSGDVLRAGERRPLSRSDRLPVRKLLFSGFDFADTVCCWAAVFRGINRSWLALPRWVLLPSGGRRHLHCDSAVPMRELLPPRILPAHSV